MKTIKQRVRYNTPFDGEITLLEQRLREMARLEKRLSELRKMQKAYLRLPAGSH